MNSSYYPIIGLFLIFVLFIIMYNRNHRRTHVPENLINEHSLGTIDDAARLVFATMPILVINLKRRADRRKKMEDRLKDMIDNVLFIEATDANDTTASLMPVAVGHTFRKAERACFSSHLRAWKAIIAEEWPVTTILEDDAVIDIKNMKDKILRFIKLLPPLNASTPILGIMGLHNEKETTLTRSNIWATDDLGMLTGGLMGSHAYILTLAAARILVPLADSAMDAPLDLFLGSQKVKDAIRHIFVINPPLVKVDDVYESDTVKD